MVVFVLDFVSLPSDTIAIYVSRIAATDDELLYRRRSKY